MSALLSSVSTGGTGPVTRAFVTPGLQRCWCAAAARHDPSGSRSAPWRPAALRGHRSGRAPRKDSFSLGLPRVRSVGQESREGLPRVPEATLSCRTPLPAGTRPPQAGAPLSPRDPVAAPVSPLPPQGAGPHLRGALWSPRAAHPLSFSHTRWSTALHRDRPEPQQGTGHAAHCTGRLDFRGGSGPFVLVSITANTATPVSLLACPPTPQGDKRTAFGGGRTRRVKRRRVRESLGTLGPHSNLGLKPGSM